MSHFTLDSRLENDTYLIGTLGLSQVLLMDDARFPWIILVPVKPDLVEIIDLAEPDRTLLMQEISVVSEALKSLFNPDKINIGALGNHVKQLHIHIIARFVSDEAWPNPVWGKGERQFYPPHMAGSLIDKIAKTLLPVGLKEDRA